MAAAVLALGGARLAAAAEAGAPPAIPPQSCDFFEAALISYLCGHTAFVEPFGAGFNLTRTQTTPVARPAGTRYVRAETRQGYEGVTLGLTPWEGVRVTVSGEAFQYDNATTQQVFPGGARTFNRVSGSKGGWLSVGAEYTLWDRSTESGRTLLNLIANFETNPAGGPYAARDLQQAGWASGAKWTLGPGLSLNFDGVTMLRRLDNPDQLQASGYVRLLLARDDWGVGVGPRLQTTTELWHSPVVKTGWNEARIGDEVLIAPFRQTGIAGLRDVTLDGYAMHSIGQASLVPIASGAASQYEYGASAQLNIRY